MDRDGITVDPSINRENGALPLAPPDEGRCRAAPGVVPVPALKNQCRVYGDDALRHQHQGGWKVWQY